MSIESVNSLSYLLSGYTSTSNSSSGSDLMSSLMSASSSGGSVSSSALADKLADSIDANEDKAWSRSELASYASKYKELSGSSLDVSALMDTYDADGDGALSSAEQASVLGGDALGLDGIASGSASSDQSLFDEIASSGASPETFMVSSLLQDTTSSLISQMFGSGSTNTSGVFGTTSSASAIKSYLFSKLEAEKTSSVDTTA
jgi:Ca2+-binding EF-hand superfamily protein